MKHKGKPENRLVTQNENRTYIKLTKGNRYSLVHILDGNCSDSSSKTLFGSFSEIDEHYSKTFNAIRRSENHMTDSCCLLGFLQIIFCANSDGENGSIPGRVSKGNHTFVAVNIFANHISRFKR